MYNYIPHPSNCRVSSNILRLLVQEGAEGYGIYWMLLELLRDAPGYSIDFEPKVLAYGLHVADVEKVTRVCRQYNLFTVSQDGVLSSPWLLEAMGEYDERKKKLQEAGRRGAAHRWKGLSLEDSKPIASLSLEDSKPIAHNPMLHDITEHNVTLPDQTGSQRVDVEYFDALCKTQPAGHAPGYVAQVCLKYGMTIASCDFICEHTENAKVTNPTYRKFLALVKRIQEEKWTPKHPDGFFLKKLFE